MSASGYWCALILLTFTQDSLGNHYEKFLQIEKPKGYLRHQQNHRTSSFVDRKLVDATEFRAAEILSTFNSPAAIRTIAEIPRTEAEVQEVVSRRSVENRRAEIRPIIARDRAVSIFRPTEIHSAAIALTRPDSNSVKRPRAENHLAGMEMANRPATRSTSEIHPVPRYRSAEIVSGRVCVPPVERHRATEKRPALRIRSAEMRSQTEERRSAKEILPTTEIRPMEVFRMEIEQAETSSVERSQIRHGRSRNHFARQKISAEDSAAKDNADAVNRIKISVRVDRENHFKTRQDAEKVSDFPETSISHKHNHSWLLERNFSKDNSVNSQSFDRVEDNVPEGLESLLKLYQARKGRAPEESSVVPLTRNLSRLIEQNFSKDNSRNGGFSDQIGDEAWRNSKVDTLRARHSENHGVLRSSPDPLKSLFKDDPLSKLRKAMFLNKTVVSTAAIDRNTTETLGIDTAEANTSETIRDLEEEEVLQDVVMDYPGYEESANITFLDRSARRRPHAIQVDIVTRFLRIIENQHTLGDNCTAGTDLNLGEGVVDQYAQERFRLEAEFAVNRANMLTRLWKYAPEVMLSSEYLLHASVLSMVEFDEDIFAAGNCYDKLQYRNRWLYCPFAHRLPNQDGILVKDLAIEYKYLSNSSEWFYIARKNAERVIASYEQFSRGELLRSSLLLSLMLPGKNPTPIDSLSRERKALYSINSFFI